MPDGGRAAVPVMRLRLAVSGAVQGVGFRPHAYRLAAGLGLTGFVRNAPCGVAIEIEGPSQAVAAFADRLVAEAPAAARIAAVQRLTLPPRGESGFVIAASAEGDAGAALLLPDLATCSDCRADIFAPHGRHAGYAFTACAACGPRFSVTAALPYDRERTALAGFPLCPACARGYDDPDDRRFHAETQACSVCGPTLFLLDRAGRRQAVGSLAISIAAERIRGGEIVAVKGIGGFHLFARADDARALATLRARKRRPNKPFAVMFPDLDAVTAWCEVAPAERTLLCSPAAPIVLLRRGAQCAAAAAVAPANPRIGVLLPYAPVHHLLLRALVKPVVATSANVSGEPLLFRDDDAADGLGGLADVVLSHDRPILRPVEDSVVQVLGEAPMVLRLGRGFAPLAAPLAGPVPPLLALGGRLKTAPAISVGTSAMLGPQLGDRDHPGTLAAQRDLIADLCRMHGVRPLAVACDAHPDDAALAAELAPAATRVVRVQHHVAHVAAAMAEHGLPGPVLGLAWDGAGYGDDGTVWGGELLLVDGARCQRFARLHPFRLPGGDAAAREPTRAAAGVFSELFGTDPAAWPAEVVGRLSEPRLAALLALCRTGHAAPLASSAGRLFDAVAAMLGLCRRNSFEGEAAVALESCAALSADGAAYPYAIAEGVPAELDWRPALRALLADLAAGCAVPDMAARFYGGLVAGAVALACRAGVGDVVLTGGCCQSWLLVTRLRAALLAHGLRAYAPERVPPGDGGLALGQLEWARRLMAAG